MATNYSHWEHKTWGEGGVVQHQQVWLQEKLHGLLRPKKWRKTGWSTNTILMFLMSCWWKIKHPVSLVLSHLTSICLANHCRVRVCFLGCWVLENYKKFSGWQPHQIHPFDKTSTLNYALIIPPVGNDCVWSHSTATKSIVLASWVSSLTDLLLFSDKTTYVWHNNVLNAHLYPTTEAVL